MNLKQHYHNLYLESLQQIKADQYQLDPLLDAETDTRAGLTLLIRPNHTVQKAIQRFLEQLKAIDPHQYYYPESDLHITVMAIISCYEGFALEQIEVAEYVRLIQKSLEGLNSFDINFRGLTASPSCILLQGFWKEDTLNHLRENLRLHFKNSNVQQSIDQRYAIQTAHSTVVRLRKPLLNKASWLEYMEGYRDFDFGTFTVDGVELVFNDWYQREEKVKKLHCFKLI